MTDVDKELARRLYRESGYRDFQRKILEQLFLISRKQVDELLAGMPTQSEEIEAAIRRGESMKWVTEFYGISSTTYYRIKKRIKKRKKGKKEPENGRKNPP